MSFAPNQMLGHYRIVEKIGEGGMGVVWRALDTALDREVAIKVLPDDFAGDSDRLARFEREAKLLASLSHPGIATIHGLHHAEQVRFLAMELVPGVDLSRRISQGPIPVDEALGIALKVAEALEAAHESGVVHRDLKPANIQIAPDGKVKVLDFGLAKALEADPGGGGGTSVSPRAPEPPVRRFELPARGPFRSGVMGRLIAISPDGRSIAYVDEGRLRVRRLARLEPVAIPTQTEPALIFWSPDSAWIGYVAVGKLWKAPAGGGESTVITDVPGGLTGGTGASWGPDGRIVLSRGEGGLYRVSALGGDFEEILKIDTDKESDFHQPAHLPDGSGVIFAAHKAGGRPDTLVLFADGRRKDLLKIDGQDIWFPIYSPTGHVLYRRQPSNGGIWALPFSLSRHEVTGEPFLVAPDGDVPSVSSDGTLVHVKGASSRMTQLVWADRSGKVLGPIGPPQEQWPFPELSPDGQYVSVSGKENEVSDLWIHDTARGTRTRLSASTILYTTASWSKDGKRVVYSEGNSPPFALKIKGADGSGEAKTLGDGWGAAFSPDGRYVLFTVLDKDTGPDLWYLETEGDGKPVLLLKAAGVQEWPRLSPDGRYFAYVSNEGGTGEIYIKRFPGAEGKWQVSVSGGHWPRWNRRGNRLYYVQGDTVMEVDVATEPALRLSKPRALFTRKPLGWGLVFGWPPGFDVSANDDRFVICQPVSDKQEVNGIVVLENWLGEFTRPE